MFPYQKINLNQDEVKNKTAKNRIDINEKIIKKLNKNKKHRIRSNFKKIFD
jgi:hypothetical protein